MPDLDVTMVRNEWLKTCGSCDAGLAVACTCPPGDHRTVIANLCDQIERLQDDEARIRKLLDQGKENAHAAVARAEAAEAFIRDLAEHGLRADLNPTVNMRTAETAYTHLTEYLKRLDDSIRYGARRALDGEPRRREDST